MRPSHTPPCLLSADLCLLASPSREDLPANVLLSEDSAARLLGSPLRRNHPLDAFHHLTRLLAGGIFSLVDPPLLQVSLPYPRRNLRRQRSRDTAILQSLLCSHLPLTVLREMMLTMSTRFISNVQTQRLPASLGDVHAASLCTPERARRKSFLCCSSSVSLGLDLKSMKVTSGLHFSPISVNAGALVRYCGS